MKILFVSTDFNRSGAALAMIELADNIKKLGDEVYVVFPGEGDAVKAAKEKGLASYVIRSYEWVKPLYRKESFHIKVKWALKHLYNIISILRLSLFIRKHNIDIVHINTLWGYVGACAAKVTKTPYVWHMREMLEQQGIKIRRESFGKRLINSANALIAISSIVANNYKTIYNSSLIHLVYDGVEVQNLEKRNKLLFSSNITYLAIVGGIREHKRQLDAIQAVELLKNRGRNVYLSVIGDTGSEYAVQVKNYVIHNDLQNNITFVGETNDVYTYLNQSDISITAAEHEAFGRVTVEGLLSGCVVVASDSGANAELIRDKKTGFIYHVGDVEDLSRVLLYIIDHKREAINCATNGQRIAFDLYDSKVSAKRIIEIYSSLT